MVPLLGDVSKFFPTKADVCFSAAQARALE